MIILRQGRRYRAKISLGFLERAVATNEMIAAKLTDAGFSEVTVTGSGGTRWAFGVWPSPDQEVSDDDMPSQIDHIEEV